MRVDIFSFNDYRLYLVAFLKESPSKGHGFRSQLAEASGVQSAYVSKILGGSADFSLEQAIRLESLLRHSREEHHYFLLLVQEARSGNLQLKNYFKLQREEILRQRMELRNRLKETAVQLSDEQKSIYYSTWMYMAIHALVSLPNYQTKLALADRLRIDFKAVSLMVDFLLEVGLLTESEGRLQIGTVRMHLGSDSPFVKQLHAQWRMKSIHSLSYSQPEDLHYTSAITLAEPDVLKIKKLLLDQIEQIKSIIKNSADEKAYSLNLDFFEI